MKILSLKKLVVLAAMTLVAASNSFGAAASGSATVNFYTYNFDDATLGQIFNVNGTTPLSGSGFSAQLWAGPNSGSMVALGPAEIFATGAFAGYVGVGSPFSPSAVTYNVPGGFAKQSITYQVLAWNNQGGTVTSYANATIRGASALITVTAGGNASDGFPTAIPPDANGFTSFALVPEPSVLALGLLGGALLLFRRRK